MNNLEEWADARRIVKEAWTDWKPHFETLTSGGGEKILALFLLADTGIEWRLYHEPPEMSLKDFADYMQDAKEELLEQVGFDVEIDAEEITEKLAGDLTRTLEEKMRQYEKRTGLGLPGLVFNMLFYSEWLALPEDVLEKRYEEEAGQ